ncbi:RNA 2',3'-cyclic phosphodiesterase [Paenibacillus xylaniclasticus]|uniref:RNA 2',3'-cyclic phosphodiesterase n=1 Tax=Paenibacillus xylaniclasticus TaxID=588083 RepID=UPI000FDC8BA5|nr:MULTISPECIES: RNA 2',3'-cyclic phosphodiesterase [Paenibacillus]GFN31265.1 RNA 2',3'-cyclic phosphodiesterase [Paenibacillus curdlanolyticus]
MDIPNEKQRLFIALPVPAPYKTSIAAMMAKLREAMPFRRWVHPDDLHVTVQFLGEAVSRQIPSIEQAIRKAVAGTPPFDIAVRGLGSFGKPGWPSVLWGGIEADAERLQALYRTVVQAMQPLGFEPEARPYKPHLTLARNYDGAAPIASQLLTDLPFPDAGETWQWKAESVTLYRSRPSSQPMYEAVGEYPFLQPLGSQ